MQLYFFIWYMNYTYMWRHMGHLTFNQIYVDFEKRV